MIQTDNVYFRFPKDRELQWPAAAVLQDFVNNYTVKMSNNDVSGGKVTFSLQYAVDISQEDWAIFEQVGLTLSRQPGQLSASPDMVVDLREERLAMYQPTAKHVAQLLGIMSGGETSPLPRIRDVDPNPSGNWAVIGDVPFDLEPNWQRITSEQLLDMPSNQWKGVIGAASWETYCACAFSSKKIDAKNYIDLLPVIEIYPATRSRTWLSKWSNPRYRMVIADDSGSIKNMVMQAIDNINLHYQIDAAKKREKALAT